MDPTPSASHSAAPPDPPPDHAATTLPNNIAVILHATRILLGYGRHLIDTLRHRASAPNFNAIAACFGTANLATILAHLNRGLLRATALERVLLARAATNAVLHRARWITPEAPTGHSDKFSSFT
jgi:hypothetical protein